MQKLIHFRSRIESHHTSESGKRIRGQSIDVQNIRAYSLGDDPRDIIWKKWIGTETLYSRERSMSTHPDVYTLSCIAEKSWAFSTVTHPRSKNDFIQELENIIRESAQKLRFSYQRASWKSWDKEEMRNTILLIIWDIDSIGLVQEYFPFSKNNDIIFVFLLHPVEISPEERDALIFESWKISSTYEEALRMSMNQWKHEFSSHDIAFLPCTTLDNPSLLLNHFFKYRYV